MSICHFRLVRVAPSCILQNAAPGRVTYVPCEVVTCVGERSRCL